EDVDVHVVRRSSAANGEKGRVPLQHQAEAGARRNGDALEDVAAAKVVGDTAAEACAEGASWKHAARHERVIVRLASIVAGRGEVGRALGRDAVDRLSDDA